MSVVARYLLARATAATAVALVAVWPFAFLGFLDRSVARTNPLIAVRPGLAVTLALVASAPAVFGLAAAGGAALLGARLDRDGESVSLQLGGTSPRRVLALGLLPAAFLSAVSLGAVWRAHPSAMQALHEASWVRPEDVPRALERLTRIPGNRDLAFSGRASGPAELADARFLVRSGADGRLALAAARGAVRRSAAVGAVAVGAGAGGGGTSSGRPGRAPLELVLEDGVAVLPGAQERLGAVAFGTARARLELGGLVGAAGRPWHRPSARPLARLAEDAEHLAGIVGERAAATRARYLFEPWHRLSLGLLPLLAAAPILVLATGARPARRRPSDALVAFLTVTLVLGQLQATAKGFATESLSSALALLAACAVAPGAAGATALALLRRGR